VSTVTFEKRAFEHLGQATILLLELHPKMFDVSSWVDQMAYFETMWMKTQWMAFLGED
jgi:hypothetical protein